MDWKLYVGGAERGRRGQRETDAPQGGQHGKRAGGRGRGRAPGGRSCHPRSWISLLRAPASHLRLVIRTVSLSMFSF